MDAIRSYLNKINTTPLLTPEDEMKFAKKARRGDTKAIRMMIQSNLRLVVNIAKRYAHFGMPLMDLVEEGNLGLIKAVKKYEPDKGYRFSTYASWWIRQFMLRGIANQSKMIRVPVYMRDNIIRWNKTHEILSQKLDGEPTMKEIARELKMPIKKAQQISSLITRFSSLEAPIGDGEGQFADILEDKSVLSPSEEFAVVLQHERVTYLLEKLLPREKKVLILRFGLEDGAPRTLESIAKRFRVSRERIRQIESSAKKKIRTFIMKEEKEEKREA